MVNNIHLKAVSAPNGATKGKQGKKWDSRYNNLFKYLNVVIIPDNDEVGREYAQTIAENILHYAQSVKIIDLVNEWDKLKPKGDITDIYETEALPKGKTKAESVSFKLSALSIATPTYKTNPKQATEFLKPVIYAPVWAYKDNGQWKVEEKMYITEFVKTHGVKCINGQLYSVDGVVNDNKAKQIIIKEILHFVNTNHGDKSEKLLKGIKAFCYCEAPKPSLDKLHFLNGTLSKNKDGLFTVWSNEKEFCINRINTNYSPTAAKPQLFYDYLNAVYHTDDIKTLQQYCGYCLLPTTLLQQALFIIGDGGEGKSVMATILNAVFGGNNCYNDSINTIEQRFGVANIENKLLFINDDLSENALKNSRQFKSLVTNKNDIQADKKFVQSNIIKSYVRFLVFGNFTLQSLYDTSEGFARRQLVLQAKPKDKNRVDNPMLDYEIISNETEGVLLWIIDGLNELLKNKYHMYVSERTRAESNRLKKENDSVLCFLEECADIIISEEQQSHSYNLYLTYSDFCEYNALTPLKQKSFIIALKSKGKSQKIAYDTHITIDGERRRGFTGVGIKPNHHYPYY